MSDSTPAANSAAASSAPAADTAPVETTETSAEETESPEATAANQKIAAAEKKATEALRKKYNLKVNGKAKDVELDLGNDAEVQKYLQKAMAADEKFQEAATTRKQMEYLIEQLRTNPLAVLQHEGINVNIKEMAERILSQEVEDMAKSPEQKRIEELERALKSKEEREKQLEDERTAEMRARMEYEVAQELDQKVTDAISKSSLPKSAYTVKRLADAMIEAVNLGYTDVTPEQIMPFVEDSITEEIQRLFEASPDEVMERLVSKKRLDGYRKSRVNKAKPSLETLKQAVKDTGSKEAPKKELPAFKVKDLFKMK